jgi:nucleoside-diphosphate-sugar epimerase/predicted dehydrogenase
MHKKLTIGLLGAGYIVDSHAKALQVLPDVEIVAVCDRAIARAEQTAKTYGIPHVFEDLTEMLKLKLDVIHVLLPPDLHVETAKQILEAGTHVFLEKPMGLDASSCQLLVDLAKQKGLKLGVNHNFLFLPAYEALRKQVADGTIGPLDLVTINWFSALGLIQFGPFNNWMLREPQNLWFELGPHLTAFMIDLVGELDEIHTHVSRPIDLPGGSRVYRKWHIHGIKGNTSVDLNMSVVPGYADRSISVRGHAAAAKCDYGRNIFYREEPSGYGMLFDSYLTNRAVARQIRTSNFNGFIHSLKHTLKKSPEANPYGISIARSVKAFYDTMNNDKLDSRLDGQFGVNVILACEKITRQANFVPPALTKQVWSVLPPHKKPTILVIGGTGFIGKYLVRKLTEAGHGVRVVTRGMSAGNIGLAGLPVELIEGDIAEAAFMDKALQGIEVIYDLAKAAGSKWDDYYKNDVLVTKNIAERAQAHGVKQFIYTGTIDSYYSANANSVITSDTPLDTNKNRNLYAKSKASCEALLLEMHKQSGFPVTIFRPGVVIGKGCPPAHWGVGMFQSESRVQFWGDGESKLPLVLVDDVADALVLALGKPDIAGQAYLLTDEPLLSARDYVDIVSKECSTKLRAEPTPIWKFFMIDGFKELAKNLIKHPNRKIPSYRDWDSRSHRARYDSTKTKQVLGWRPVGNKEILIEKGIVAAVREFGK